jgi:predicted nucleic acid-binding protein
VSTYFDASAMVKLLLVEEGSATAGRLWAQATEPFVSIVGYAELRGSVARAARGGRIADDDYTTARLELERMWGSLAAIRLDGRLTRLAGSLADRHALTALDAIHLASALSLRDPGEDVAFVTFDRRLAEAALAEGLTVLPEVA